MHLFKFIFPDMNDKIIVEAADKCNKPPSAPPPNQPPPPATPPPNKTATANGKYKYTFLSSYILLECFKMLGNRSK